MRNLKIVLLWALVQGLLVPIAYAQDPVDAVLEDMVRSTLEARHRYREAKQALHDLVRGSDEWEVARRRHDDAYTDYHHHARTLDHERVRVLARESGLPPKKIAHMRDSGMGWGRVAKEVGVHPGVLGRGHHKADAKARDDHYEHAGKHKAVKGKRGNGRRNAKGPKKNKKKG